MRMARFKQNAHDVYEKNADFIHENSTLTKTVQNASEHFHKSNLSWSSDKKITLDSPEIEETYHTIIRRKNFSFYTYALFKGLFTNYNQSLFGYSKNKSIMYLNLSGMTTNNGIVFMLPGAKLYYTGAYMLKFSLFTKDDVTATEDSRKFVVDSAGNASIDTASGKSAKSTKKVGTTTVNTSSNTRYIKYEKSKHIGGIYIKKTNTQYLS